MVDEGQRQFGPQRLQLADEACEHAHPIPEQARVG
jgi:hypothetical protein